MVVVTVVASVMGAAGRSNVSVTPPASQPAPAAPPVSTPFPTGPDGFSAPIAVRIPGPGEAPEIVGGVPGAVESPGQGAAPAPAPAP